MLNTKDGLWESSHFHLSHKWTFKTKQEKWFCIEKVSSTKVLEAKTNGEVLLKEFIVGKAQQLWRKGEPDAKGYFTLENHKVTKTGRKILTGISSGILQIKSNITLRWIPYFRE